MALLLTPATAVWLALMLATCASTWWLKSATAAPFVATALIMLIAAVKVRLVIIHFMELGNAPLRWRFLFEAWVVAVSAIILAGYWVARQL